jgi:hypothetical protein
MTIMPSTARIALAWMVLVAAQTVLGGILGMPVAPGTLFWVSASNLLVVAVLYVAAARSGQGRLALGAALFAIQFSISLVNVVEAAVFLHKTGISPHKLLLHDFGVYILAAPLWAVIFVRAGQRSTERAGLLAHVSLRGWVWRLGLSDFAYLFFYFLAGIVAFPFFREFYASQALPSTSQTVMLQLMLRGPIFTGVCLLLMSLLNMERRPGVIALGASFAILSGMGPLLIPNPYLPDSVRWVHFVEVGISNFLFGALMGWIWHNDVRGRNLQI